jgi:hypothetical protein
MTAWTFAPGRCFFPEYQALMSSPFALVTVSARRSVSKILPSRTTYGTPSAMARSRASSRPGACADSTSTASSNPLVVAK